MMAKNYPVQVGNRKSTIIEGLTIDGQGIYKQSAVDGLTSYCMG